MIMARKKGTIPTTRGDSIQATIGDNASQVAVGKNIHQQQVNGSGEITAADLQQVRTLFDDFKKQIELQAPPDKKAAALERVDELQQEVLSKKPELSTFDYVKQWFGKNLPGLLGGVTSLVVNPIVGKVVEASAGLAVNALKRRFEGS
jgi:hypothetical protein